MKVLPKVIPGRVSDALYDASIGKLNSNPCAYNNYYKTCIIHMIDGVSRGTISPMEAYDALAADYFPEYLLIRESAYKRLL